MPAPRYLISRVPLMGEVPECLPLLGRETGRGRFFQQFLMPPLQGAVALAQEGDFALAVAEHLHLDMPGGFEEALDVHLAVAERRLRLRAREREYPLQFGLGAHDPHPAPAAARRRFEHDGEADAPRGALQIAVVRGGRLQAGEDRQPGAAHRLPRHRLVAHPLDRLGARADEGDAEFLAHLRHVGVLGEEAVAGMDRVAPGQLRRRDDRRPPQIRLRRRPRPDADRLVRQLHRQRIPIRLRIRHHGGQPEVPARAQYPQRDLPPVGDQHLLQHRQSSPET